MLWIIIFVFSNTLVSCLTCNGLSSSTRLYVYNKKQYTVKQPDVSSTATQLALHKVDIWGLWDSWYVMYSHFLFIIYLQRSALPPWPGIDRRQTPFQHSCCCPFQTQSHPRDFRSPTLAYARTSSFSPPCSCLPQMDSRDSPKQPKPTKTPICSSPLSSPACWEFGPPEMRLALQSQRVSERRSRTLPIPLKAQWSNCIDVNQRFCG